MLEFEYSNKKKDIQVAKQIYIRSRPYGFYVKISKKESFRLLNNASIDPNYGEEDIPWFIHKGWLFID